MKHTPEPWVINDWPQADSDISIGAAGAAIIARVTLRNVSVSEQRANAMRITACVNACAGISNHALERQSGLLQALKQAHKFIASITIANGAYPEVNGSTIVREAYKQASAAQTAINKVEN